MSFTIKTARSDRAIAMAMTRIRRKDNNMSVKIISYDLNSPESSRDYVELIDYIKSLGDWIKPMYSFWLIDTPKHCKTIRDEAKKYLDENDRFFVATWSIDDWATYHLPKTAAWLNK